MEGLPSQVGDVRTPLAAVTPSPIRNVEQSDISYAISVTGTQLIFNGTTFNQIRGTFFQRDSAYFAFRNVLDQLIATVKTQFYQIIVNRDLVSVNEENVHLLEAQLKDQQNRFEAGTVPRFNVLQADVQLHNQIPQLITAQNNLRISKLQLAKTLGLDFQRRFGDRPPLEVIGDMPYIPRSIELVDAIEMGKQRRAFLKQARANVLNQLQQVRAAAGQWLPNITTTGGGEWVSSPINSSWHDISKGWTALVQGSVPIWDSGAIAGQVIQQRALLSETKITYDDDVRQVELEIQQAYSNLQQNRELIQSQEKNVELADEALRLAKARLDAGAGVQLDVLNATVQLLQRNRRVYKRCSDTTRRWLNSIGQPGHSYRQSAEIPHFLQAAVGVAVRRPLRVKGSRLIGHVCEPRVSPGSRGQQRCRGRSEGRDGCIRRQTGRAGVGAPASLFVCVTQTSASPRRRCRLLRRPSANDHSLHRAVRSRRQC